MSTPSSLRAKSAAASMERRPVRLQQRGPPTAAMRARQSETRRWAAAQRSAASGDAPQAMLAKIPAPAAAPQTPSAPQEPPGRRLPRALGQGRGQVKLQAAVCAGRQQYAGDYAVVLRPVHVYAGQRAGI